MPKAKSHSGAHKRFKVSGKGKVRREKTGMRHNLERKASKTTRRMRGTTDVSRSDQQRAKRLLRG